MKVTFPASMSATRRTDVSPVEVVFDSLLLNSSEYETFARAYASNSYGVPVAQFGGLFKLEDATHVLAWGRDHALTLHNVGRKATGIVVLPQSTNWDRAFGEYEAVCADDSVSTIVVPTLSSQGLDRVEFLYQLVQTGRFCKTKSHWLYGIPNPAELGIYPTLFSGFICGKIELAICSSCFVYSMYGVRFSDSMGIVMPLPNANDTRFFDLGMMDWFDFAPTREQMRYFHLNIDTVLQFARGKTAESYFDMACAILDVGVT